MEKLHQISPELKEKLNTFLQSEGVKKFIESTKDATETGTFEGMVISTEHEDRQGEIVMQAGMDTGLYMQNPVVLNSHNYYGIENIIGLTTRLYQGEVGGVKATLADGIWAPTEAGQMARKLWDAKMANASSIGFIAMEFDKVRPNVITRSQLLEFSIVPVPANGYATRLRALGLDVDAVRAKGFEFKTEGVDAEEKPAEPEAPVAPAPEPEKPATPPAEVVPETPAPEPVPAPEQKDQAQTVGAILAELSNIVSDAVVRASQLILGIVQSEFGKSAEGKAEIKAAEGTINAIKKQLAELEKSLKSGAGEEQSDGAAQKQRSEGSGEDSMKELNDFLLTRQLLRSVVTAANEGIVRVNEKIKTRSARR